MTARREIYADILRFFAIFAVVTIHVSGRWVENLPITSTNWWIANLYDSFSRWCVPIFVMLSGAFLLQKPDEPLKHFLCNRANKVLIPYIFWLGIYFLWRMTVFKRSFDSTLFIKELLNGSGNTYFIGHLWFFPLILGLYFATPVLRIMVKHARKEHLLYFLLCWVVFALSPYYATRLFKIRIAIYPTIFTIWVGYFVLGYYLNRYVDSQKKYMLPLFVAAWAVTALGTFFLSRSTGNFTSVFYSYRSPNVAIMAFSIFLIIKSTRIQFLEKSKTPEKLSSAVLGIYLIHGIIIKLSSQYTLPIINYNLFIGIAVKVFTVVMLSFVCVSFLKRIPVLRRIVP